MVDIEIYVATSDHGPDISTARTAAVQELHPELYKWWFDNECLAHQYHLMTGGLLFWITVCSTPHRESVRPVHARKSVVGQHPIWHPSFLAV